MALANRLSATACQLQGMLSAATTLKRKEMSRCNTCSSR